MSERGVGDIGAYIRAQRETAKVSLRQLARNAGVSNPYLSQIERGLRRPSAEILQALLDVYWSFRHEAAGTPTHGPTGSE